MKGMEIRNTDRFVIIRSDVEEHRPFKNTTWAERRKYELVYKLITRRRRLRLFIRTFLQIVATVALLVLVMSGATFLALWLHSIGVRDVRIIGIPCGLGTVLAYFVLMDKIAGLFKVDERFMVVKHRGRKYRL